MMNDNDFKKLFAYATGLYANPGTHEGSANSYWGFLKSYSHEVLREAFKRAVKSSPEFFPSAPRVRECAEAAAKSLALPKADLSRPALPPGRNEYVPPIGGGAEEWVNEATGKFERLARVWQVESKAMRLDPSQPTPHEIGTRRLKEFWATWDKSDSPTSPTSGELETDSDSPLTGSGSKPSTESPGSSAGRLSHGGDCVCELCMPAVMRRAEQVGLVR